MIKDNGQVCKRCGNQVVSYETPEIREKINHCYSCGWENSLVPREDSIGINIDRDGEIIIDKVRNEGYGVFSMYRNDNIIEMHSFSKPITEEEIGRFMIELIRSKDIVMKKSYLSVWNEDEEKLEMFFGELPDAIIFEEGDSYISELT